MDNSICKFIPYKNDFNSLHTINFVYETKNLKSNGISPQSVYKIHFVCSGKGVLHLKDKEIILEENDIFFIFPGVPFSIETVDDLKYMYISFLGSRSNMIMNQLGISNSNFYFSNCKEVYDFWKNGLELNIELSDLITESILLYSFYYLGKKLYKNKSVKSSDLLSLKIKKYIDENYYDCTLSLEVLSKKMSYSPNYISYIFKKEYNISITDYLTTLRIQHACTFFQQGFTSVSEVSYRCGYSDPQYFSKVFKKILKKTPSDYIKKPNN